MQSTDPRGDGQISFQFDVDISECRAFVDCEEAIQKALNDAGKIATAELLKRFDTRGEPFEYKDRWYTSKGLTSRRYETPYGSAEVAHHVFQHSGGGATYCPLDNRAGIVLSATPKLARMVASKYAEFGSSRVQEDMESNHGRRFSRGYVSNLAEAVAMIAESQSSQNIYRLPEFDTPTASLVIAVDEIELTDRRPTPAKVAIGSVGYYDGRGQRQYVVYVSDLFEPKSSTDESTSHSSRFPSRLGEEIRRAKKILVDGGPIIGISDGRPWTIELLANWTPVQFIDPERTLDLLYEAAGSYFDRNDQASGPGEAPRERAARRLSEKNQWIRDARSRIRSEDGLRSLIQDLQRWLDEMEDNPGRTKIAAALEFIKRERRGDRMNYWDGHAALVFANAGILEDSAKVLFGDRMRHPKYKIGLGAARAILVLRELTRTPGRWDEFWQSIAVRQESTREQGRINASLRDIDPGHD